MGIYDILNKAVDTYLQGGKIMDSIYAVGGSISFLGVIILLTGFRKNFGSLNSIQKAGISLATIGAFIPFIDGFIKGFISC